MSTRPGLTVRRARLAAVLGRPMPTKHDTCPRRARAAATVIISSAVNVILTSRKPRQIRGLASLGGSCRDHLVQPRLKRRPVAADGVPVAVEVVVAVVVALRVGRPGA